MSNSVAINQFIDDLASLARNQPTDKVSLDAWYARSRNLVDQYRSDSRLSDLELEHHIWHWLSDADIRAKEAEFAQMQDEQFREFIEDMRNRYAT